MSLLQSSPTPLQVSKWMDFSVLLSDKELQDLFSFLSDFFLYSLGQISDQALVFPSTFLAHYKKYQNALQSADIPDRLEVNRNLSVWMTREKEAMDLQLIPQNRMMASAVIPAIRIQHHQFHFSREDQQIRSRVVGNTVSWGIQISYPQLWINQQGVLVNLKKQDPLGNASLFQSIGRWMRKKTRPAPLFFEKKRITHSVRIGFEALQWAEKIQELNHFGLKICL